MVKQFILFTFLAFMGYSAHSQAVNSSQVKSESEVKANLQPGDEYKVSTYDTQEKVAKLELRIERIKGNIELNKDNPKYDMAEMKDILAKLEKVYGQIDPKLKPVKATK